MNGHVATLNYRHAYHAGNFADVFKHVVLVRTLLHLRTKESAFRVIETHAGAGRYDLSADPAARTGEWRNGIGRLLAQPVAGAAGKLIEPYLSLVRTREDETEINSYPGSPAIAISLARPQDRLTFFELHPDDRAALARLAARDRRIKVNEADGWHALKSSLPPPERRGLVLIDPPFEQPGEFQRLAEGLSEAVRRWATGNYIFWYPIKNPREVEKFARRIAALGIPRILRAELSIGGGHAENALTACGLLVVNPPWTLPADLKTIIPALTQILAPDGRGGFRLEWLAP